jgi:hypothetical protein
VEDYKFKKGGFTLLFSFYHEFLVFCITIYRKMKVIALISVLFAFASLSHSQEHDARLLAHFEKTELSELKANQPEEYEFLTLAVEKAIFIGPIPQEKEKDITFDGEIEIDPNGKHTYLSLGIEIKENQYQYFKIKGTNQLVGVLPKSLIK